MVSYNYAPKTIGRAVSLTQRRRNLKRNCFCGAFQPVLRRYVLSIVPRYYVIVEGAAGNLDRWCLQSCGRSKILRSKRLQNVAHHHHHQTPWDQRPLVSTARFTRILHPALSTASPANKWMSLLHHWMISSDHLLLGLPLRFLPRSIPNSTLFTSLSSSILQIWPKNVNFLSITLCTMFRCLPILVRIAWFRIFCCHLIFSILL